MRIAVFDVGGTAVKHGLFDTQAGLLTHDQFPAIVGDAPALADAIAQVTARYDCQRVGVGTAGSVNLQSGCITATNLRWQQQPLRQMLQQRLAQPVWVDNDAKAALMAEWYDGACKNLQSAVYLVLGTGVGGALLLDGRPYKGHDNTAGELGHMLLHADGPRCSCGRHGCFELYASTRALQRMAQGKPAPDILQGVRAHNPDDCAVFSAWLHELGLGLASLVRMFNPQAIVLGGGISAAGDVFLQGIRHEVRSYFTHRPEYYAGEIYLAQHGNDAGLIGAGVLAMQNL